MEGLTEKNPLFPRFHRSCLILQGVFAKGSEHRGSSHAQMIDINLRLFSHPPFSLAEIEATASPVECLTLMDIKDIIETTLKIVQVIVRIMIDLVAGQCLDQRVITGHEIMRADATRPANGCILSTEYEAQSRDGEAKQDTRASKASLVSGESSACVRASRDPVRGRRHY